MKCFSGNGYLMVMEINVYDDILGYIEMVINNGILWMDVMIKFNLFLINGYIFLIVKGCKVLVIGMILGID